MERIEINGQLFAIIIRKEYSNDGIEFFTPGDFSQQVAYMKHPQGKKIDAHTHNVIERKVFYTQEVLLLRKGLLRVDFYTNQASLHHYVGSCIVRAGDVILLVSGGHGFECLDEVEMIEIKQGPYLGENDKVRFPGVNAEEVKLLL